MDGRRIFAVKGLDLRELGSIPYRVATLKCSCLRQPYECYTACDKVEHLCDRLR